MTPSRAGAGRTLPRTTAQLSRRPEREGVGGSGGASPPGAGGEAADPVAIAAQGVAGAGGPLPFLDEIQGAFGHHDVRGVGAHVGGAAGDAAGALGARAYATGDQVGFAGAPDLHLAAHEAAHVVQQRAGVQLAGGVGAAGDPYERHADRAADAVVAGRSAAAILDEMGGGDRAGAPGVQREEANGGGLLDRFTHDISPSVRFPHMEVAHQLTTLRGADAAGCAQMLRAIDPDRAEHLLERLQLKVEERALVYLALPAAYLRAASGPVIEEVMLHGRLVRDDARRLFARMTTRQRMNLIATADGFALARMWPGGTQLPAQEHAALLGAIDDARVTAMLGAMEVGAAVDLYLWLPAYVADRIRDLAPPGLQYQLPPRSTDQMDAGRERDAAGGDHRAGQHSSKDRRMSDEQIRRAVIDGMRPGRLVACYADWNLSQRNAALAVASPAQLAGLLGQSKLDTAQLWFDVTSNVGPDAVTAVLRRLDDQTLLALRGSLDPGQQAELDSHLPPERAARSGSAGSAS